MKRQMLGSLLVALAIVAVTIAVVSAHVGPGREDGGGDRQGQEDHSGRGR